MSGATQGQMLKRLTERIRRDYPTVTVTDEREWSNTGVLIVRPDQSFDALMRVAYSFQDNYATFWTDPAPHESDGATGTASYAANMPHGEPKSWRAFHLQFDRNTEADYRAVENFVIRTLGRLTDGR